MTIKSPQENFKKETVWLDAGPFAEWIDLLYQVHKVQPISDANNRAGAFVYGEGGTADPALYEFYPGALNGVARLIGQSRRRLGDWVRIERTHDMVVARMPKIPLRFVDKCCTTYGVHISELYDWEEIDNAGYSIPDNVNPNKTCNSCGVEMSKAAKLCGFCIEEQTGELLT